MKCKLEHRGDCFNSGSPWYFCKCEQPCDNIIPMTNGDRIRAMTDEELAEFLNRKKEPCNYCQLAVVEGACTETLCDDAMMNWLQQAAEEVSTDA